jgi:hypothetical protein
MTSGRETKAVKKSVLGTAVVRKCRRARVLKGMFVPTAGKRRLEKTAFYLP